MLPLQIVAEEVSGTNDYVQLTFRAHKLDNKVRTPEPRSPTTDKSQSLSSAFCSLLAASPCRPHQAHGPFFICPSRICSASLTLSWRSIRLTGTRVTSWSGGPRLVPGAMAKKGGRAE